MRKRTAIFLLAVLLTVNLSHGFAQTSRDPLYVSILSLISCPEKFNNRAVRIKGYLWIEYEGNAIYCSKTDKVYNITKNAIALRIGSDLIGKANLCKGKYVVIEGVFSADSAGHMGLFSGEIQSLNRISIIAVN